MSAARPVVRPAMTIADQVKAEFKTYWASAEKSRLPNPARQRELIASAHKYAMCFSFIARAIKEQQEHRRIFFQELTSDAVHLVHALTGGDARGGRFYLRSVIENFWRHHYFRDHVVEYGWLHTRNKYFHEMKDLREHCGWLDCFKGDLAPLMSNLPRLYSELSTSVHSTSSKTLVLRQSLSDIRLLEEQGKALSRELLGTLKVCLALCICSEKNEFLALHVNVQQYLLNALSVSQRKAVVAFLPKLDGDKELEAPAIEPPIEAETSPLIDDQLGEPPLSELLLDPPSQDEPNEKGAESGG